MPCGVAAPSPTLLLPPMEIVPTPCKNTWRRLPTFHISRSGTRPHSRHGAVRLACLCVCEKHLTCQLTTDAEGPCQTHHLIRTSNRSKLSTCPWPVLAGCDRSTETLTRASAHTTMTSGGRWGQERVISHNEQKRELNRLSIANIVQGQLLL